MARNRVPIAARKMLGETRLTVLAAERDPEVLTMLRQVTPPDLYRIEEVAEPAEFSEFLRWLDVALVVVDVDMIRRAEGLREQLRFRGRLGLPVIVTAGQDSTTEDEVLARSLGCVLYAPKPCGYWMLHEAVGELLCAPVGRSKGDLHDR